jgi:endo-1,4-beta-D-glucanase Y
MGTKTKTTINLSKNVLADIRSSGVRNVSKYFEDLARADLYAVEKLTKQEKEQLTILKTELKNLSKEWQEYMKKKNEAKA